ncbi:MAG: hypothetical protein ACYDGY_01800, partial [Acidimicrobiales bacterium]
TYFFFAPLFLPLFVLGVPIADMAFAFIRRTARGQSFHTPDKDHVHHRLLRLGHGHRRTVLILWAWTAVLSAFVLFPLFTKSGNAFIPLVVACLGLFLYTLFRPGLRRDTGDSGDDDPVPSGGGVGGAGVGVGGAGVGAGGAGAGPIVADGMVADGGSVHASSGDSASVVLPGDSGSRDHE